MKLYVLLALVLFTIPVVGQESSQAQPNNVWAGPSVAPAGKAKFRLLVPADIPSLPSSKVGLSNVDNTSDATKNAASVTLTNKTLTSPVITNIVPGADFTLTQNSVAPFTSVNTGAVANTLYLKTGNVGILTSNPVSALVVGGSQSGNAGLEIAAGSGIVVQSFNRTGGAYTSINFDGSTIGFRPSGTSKMSIDSTGVGIGTTGPSGLLDVNDDHIRVRTAKTPASASAAGNAGDIAWDSSFLYVCVSANTWKRVAIATW